MKWKYQYHQGRDFNVEWWEIIDEKGIVIGQMRSEEGARMVVRAAESLSEIQWEKIKEEPV